MKKSFKLRGGNYEFRVFPLNHKLKDSPPPIPAVLGDPEEPLRMYQLQIEYFHRAVGVEYVQTPFVFADSIRPYGDFVGNAGQREFHQTRVLVSEAPLILDRPMQDVRRFADLAQVLRFPNTEQGACVRALHVNEDEPVSVVIGPGSYEEVFATMNSQGIRFSLTREQLVAAEIFWGPKGRAELARLSQKLRSRYGAVTIRQAVHKHCGGLPRLGDSVASYLLGMAAVIVTTDGYAVFGRRAKKKVSLNTGISLATSGGLKYDGDKITKLGFSRFVESEILREALEEVAILGSDCAVTVLAFVRELSRAGSPEILAQIEFFGTLRELVRRMEKNHHPEQDVDAIFALPLARARELVREPDATKALQPKALVTLIMLDRHLRSGLV